RRHPGWLRLHLRGHRRAGAPVAVGAAGCGGGRHAAVLRRVHGNDALGLHRQDSAACLGGGGPERSAGSHRLLAAVSGKAVMKEQSITQKLSWLHTWGGLIFGWILFAIFLTGTLAVFDKEISHWMQPEIQQKAVTQAFAAQKGLDWLATHKPDAGNWNISLPTERSPALRVSAEEGRRGAGQMLDAQTGEAVEVRESAGGGFFFRFHFTLNLPRNIGIWTVSLAAMAMLAALVSGIVIHKKFF